MCVSLCTNKMALNNPGTSANSYAFELNSYYDIPDGGKNNELYSLEINDNIYGPRCQPILLVCKYCRFQGN